MKITFEVPDKTLSVFLNFVFNDKDGLKMDTISAGTSEIESGNVIKWKRKETQQ